MARREEPPAEATLPPGQPLDNALRFADEDVGPLAADRDDLRAPRAARCGDVDLVADPGPEEGAPERRLRRDAAHARDLDLHALAVVVLDLDPGADGDHVARGGGRLV